MINLPFLQTYFSFHQPLRLLSFEPSNTCWFYQRGCIWKLACMNMWFFVQNAYPAGLPICWILWHLESSTNNTAWQPFESHFLLIQNLPQDAGLCILAFLKFRKMTSVWYGYISSAQQLVAFLPYTNVYAFPVFLLFPLITSHPFFESQEMIWL